MKITEIISNKTINYPFAGIVWIICSLLLHWLCIYVGLDNKFWLTLSFITGAIFAFGDRTHVPILSRGLVTFNDEEVKDGDDSLWLDPGMYFTFFLFKINNKEAQKTERRDVVIAPFECQDKNRFGLTAEANGDWIIIQNDTFKKQDESKMESNLLSLVRRSIIRVFATLDFDNEIKGKELGSIVEKDPTFVKECKKYGIEFHNLIVDCVPSDLKQENLNAYARKLFNEEKAKYPAGHPFTHKEIQDINETVQVQIGKAKKIISNSPLMGRFDIDGK